MTTVIASLSENGWITDSSKKLNYILSYYILTDNAQSLVFQGNLINLPYTYYLYINDPDGMVNQIKSDLDKLLSRYFTQVEVLTEVSKLTDSRYAILIYAAVIDEEGKRIELSRVTEMDTSGLRKVIEVNNYGDGITLINSLT